jgi:DNA uptake protein ComE-like DNA-binding protein
MPVPVPFRCLLLSALCVAISSAVAAAEPATRLNPNTATEAELQALPQLDAAVAAHILASRPFESIGDFDEALSDHLDEDAREALYEFLFVPISLNTASRDDIMLVPGMSARMAYEFEEYRPYDSLAQFDREIGKYVDDEEVARLRSYVTLGED